MCKKKFGNPLVPVNICVIGQEGDGKSTLLIAIGAVMNNNGGLTYRHNHTLNIHNHCTTDYVADDRIYTFHEFGTPVNFVKYIVSGEARFDAVILVVSAEKGYGQAAAEQIRIANWGNTPIIGTYINKCDLIEDEAFLELIEMEIDALVYKPNDYHLPYGRGSAYQAACHLDISEGLLREMLHHIELCVPSQVAAIKKPLLIIVEEIYSSSAQSLSVSGYVETGTIDSGSEIQIVNQKGDSHRAICSGIEMFKKPYGPAVSGDTVLFHLQGIEPSDLEQAAIIGMYGSLHPRDAFRAGIYVMTEEEKGSGMLSSGQSGYQFRIRKQNTSGTVAFSGGAERMAGGDYGEIEVKLKHAVVIESGLCFTIREGDRTVAMGVIL